MSSITDGPLVSVIIPAYNQAHTLGRALQSAIDQTYHNLEIIVVDDGSTDGIERVVKNFTDLRICYLRHEHNRGAAAARNTGISEAKGHYVAFLDSDDEWMSEKIAVQFAALMGTGEKVVAGCTGSYRIRNDYTETVRPSERAYWFKLLLLGCGLGPGTTLMTSRTAFENVGYFDEFLSRLEDWDWLLRYTESYPFVCISEPLAKIYVGKRPRASVMDASTQHVIQKHQEKFYRFGTWYGRKAISRHFLNLSIYWFSGKNFLKGYQYLLRGLLLYPIQRPGFYLTLLDIILGTRIAVWALKYKERLKAR